MTFRCNIEELRNGEKSCKNSRGKGRVKGQYRVVQLDLTPEIEVLHMMFERSHTKNRKRSIKQHFNFQSQVQLDHPVVVVSDLWGSSSPFSVHQSIPKPAIFHNTS